MLLRMLCPVALCLGLSASTVSADVILVPPELANTSGRLGGVTPFSFPSTNGIRTQVVYDASLFGTLTGPISITAIQFRPIDPVSGLSGNTLTVSNARLQLSTTARSDENRNPLTTNFATNLGTDAKTVYSGPLTLTTAGKPTNSLGAFDYVITLQTPFEYDPSKGNLLLDTNVPLGGSVRGNSVFGAFARFDTTSRPNDGIYSVFNTATGAATNGTVDTSGPVTQFVYTPVVTTPVPTPASLLLAAAGGAVLLARRRLQRV